MAAATATMAEIRAGITANLATIKTAWNLNDYWTSMSSPPFISVVGAAIDFDTAMGRGSDTMYWTVLACVPATSDQASQTLLETLIDPTSATSFKTLVEADRTLGSVVSWAHVVNVSKPNLYTPAGQPESLGVEFTVEVMT